MSAHHGLLADLPPGHQVGLLLLSRQMLNLWEQREQRAVHFCKVWKKISPLRAYNSSPCGGHQRDQRVVTPSHQRLTVKQTGECGINSINSINSINGIDSIIVVVVVVFRSGHFERNNLKIIYFI